MVAIDNKIEQAMVSCSTAPSPPVPSPFTPRVLCPGGDFLLPGGCSAQGGGVLLPTGEGPIPHPSAKAELLFVCDRREAHWLQPLRSAQGARVDMEGDFRGLELPELGFLGAWELQPPKSQGKGRVGAHFWMQRDQRDGG